MTAILYIMGLGLGISAFLYFINGIDSGSRKIKEIKNKKNGNQTQKENSNIELENQSALKIPPGTRICPVCRSPLEKWEPLYSSRIRGQSEEKIFIHGCSYCYKDE